MKLIIKDITSRGLELCERLEAGAIGLSPEDLQCLTPLTIKAKISRVENTVLVNIHIQGGYSFLCARCLETSESDLSQEFNLDYAIEKGLEFIDLSEDIRQEIILSSPAKILCIGDCKGLCPRCAVNLNKEQCQCKKSQDTKPQVASF